MLDEVRERRRSGATMVVLAGRSAADTAAAWVEPSGTARLIGVGERPPMPDADPDADPDDAVEVAARTLRALVDAEGAPPARLWMVGPADADRSYFRDLADAAALAELPAPSWVPLPVALVGRRLAVRFGAAGRVGTVVVLDARAADLTVWPVRAGAGAPEVAGRGPVEVTDRVDELLTGVVRAMLGVPTPDSPDSPDSAGAVAARRDAVRLYRAARGARRMLATSVVTDAPVRVGEREGSVERDVFSQLVGHAVAECLARVGAAPGVELLADASGPVAGVLLGATRAVISEPGGPREAVLGAAALAGATLVESSPMATAPPAPRARPVRAVEPRPDVAGEPSPDPATTGLHHPEDPSGPASRPVAMVATPSRPGRPRPSGPPTAPGRTPRAARPWWVVPALAAVLVVVLLGSIGVLVLGPSPTAWTMPFAAVPAAQAPSPGVSP